MNWLGRYVKEVARYLPGRNRNDVAEELQSLLDEKIADREASLERELTDDEMVELIRSFGHPLKVAANYSGSNELVSRDLYPLYLLVTRYFVVSSIAAYLLFVVWRNLVVEPTFPGYQLGVAFNFTFAWIGIITVIFHYVGRHIESQHLLERWNPRTLPPAESETLPIAASAFVGMLVLGWFVALNLVPMDHSLDLLLGREGNLILTFVFWLKIQAVMVFPVYFLLMFMPAWTTGKRLTIIASDVAMLFGLGICMTLETPALPANPGTSSWLAVTAPLILSAWMLGNVIDIAHHIRRMGLFTSQVPIVD